MSIFHKFHKYFWILLHSDPNTSTIRQKLDIFRVVWLFKNTLIEKLWFSFCMMRPADILFGPTRSPDHFEFGIPALDDSSMYSQMGCELEQ